MRPRNPTLSKLAVAVAFVAALSALHAQSSPPPPPPPPLTPDDLFDQGTVNDVQLEVNRRDWAELKERFRENVYYQADLRWRGEVVRNVGIRSRGRGSRSETKPGLRVDFNKYVTGQQFLGLKSVVLDNLTQDPAMLKERVVMRFFAEMGLPAPRVAHVRLFVNGEFAGLYTIVESIDKDFLKRTLNENDGYLYEFTHTDPYGFEYLGSALEKYAEFFEPKTHEHDSMFSLYYPIKELAWSVSESPDTMFVSSVNQYLDLRTLFTYAAIENFLADRDGLFGDWGMNNFYLYRFEGKNLSQLLPWDKDSSFWAIDYGIWTNMEANALARRALKEAPLQRVYLEALRRSAELALRPPEPAPGVARRRTLDEAPQAGWLEREIRFVYSQIREFAHADEAKPFSTERFEDEMGKVLEFSRARPRYVLHETEQR